MEEDQKLIDSIRMNSQGKLIVERLDSTADLSVPLEEARYLSYIASESDDFTELGGKYFSI